MYYCVSHACCINNNNNKNPLHRVYLNHNYMVACKPCIKFSQSYIIYVFIFLLLTWLWFYENNFLRQNSFSTIYQKLLMSLSITRTKLVANSDVAWKNNSTALSTGKIKQSPFGVWSFLIYHNIMLMFTVTLKFCLSSFLSVVYTLCLSLWSWQHTKSTI